MGAPIIFVVELVVPLLLAITIGGESWGSNRLSRCSITARIGLLIVSVTALMQTPSSSQLLAADHQPADLDARTRLRAASTLVVA
jgi:hypothetical protein